MADYIKRNDLFVLSRDYSRNGEWEEAVPVTAIRNIPPTDVVEVVRCKDCRHRDPEDHKCDCGKLERAGCVFPMDDDYFCAYGEKREKS